MGLNHQRWIWTRTHSPGFQPAGRARWAGRRPWETPPAALGARDTAGSWWDGDAKGSEGRGRGGGSGVGERRGRGLRSGSVPRQVAAASFHLQRRTEEDRRLVRTMKPVVIHVRYVQNDMDNRTHISSSSVRMYTQKIYMFLPSTSLYISFCHPDLNLIFLSVLLSV